MYNYDICILYEPLVNGVLRPLPGHTHRLDHKGTGVKVSQGAHVYTILPYGGRHKHIYIYTRVYIYIHVYIYIYDIIEPPITGTMEKVTSLSRHEGAQFKT